MNEGRTSYLVTCSSPCATCAGNGKDDICSDPDSPLYRHWTPLLTRRCDKYRLVSLGTGLLGPWQQEEVKA